MGKRIAVYCSAKDSIPEEYLALGEELGTWLAQSGFDLVYGGATGGLMSRTSNAFAAEVRDIKGSSQKQKTGKILGVVPHRIIESKRLASNCDKTYVVRTMNARKQKMKELSDCFVCLPGSYGTLDEMYDVIASGTVGEHRKPLYVVNYKGFYNALQEEADMMRELRFLPEQEHYKPIFVDNLEQLFEIITNSTKI